MKLDWKAPADGGKPAAYEVHRRERDGGTWQSVATALATEVNLVDQPRGKELEYQVIAVNKAGPGEESNTVMCVM
ncbi:MAG: fibronectin type III domain-containing protein [Phycisphaerae bacterium]|nr:fibronectin type III domain-containing protein [Phycisphaerae bacterium]